MFIIDDAAHKPFAHVKLFRDFGNRHRRLCLAQTANKFDVMIGQLGAVVRFANATAFVVQSDELALCHAARLSTEELARFCELRKSNKIKRVTTVTTCNHLFSNLSPILLIIIS